ncbi:MAG: hypothetical protein WCS65_05175 [Verrucomicrobiae bacterium]
MAFALRQARSAARSHPYVARSLRWLDEAKLRRVLAGHSGRKDLAFVILMPGSLHLGLLALKYLSQYQDVVLIANGLSAQELAITKKEESGGQIDMIALRTLLHHCEIIDGLVGAIHEPFWIVDHDCYLLSGGIFEENPGGARPRAGRAIFAFRNENLLIPETFLMQLNPRVLRAISHGYSVTSRPCAHDELPDQARQQLEAAGWGLQSYPEPHKNYYDTLRVLALLSQSLGMGFDISPGYSTRCEFHSEAVHIGNTSRPQWTIDPSFYNAIGAYFWKLSLHERDDIRQLALYQDRDGSLPSLGDMREQLVQSGCSPALLDRLALLPKK